jgi:hypothetical protein
MRAASTRTEPLARRELALVAAALLLPIPLLAASGLMVPLPSAVERALVSLLPGGEVETGSRGGQPVSTSSRSTTAPRVASGNDGAGTEQSSAGVLSEGGNATAPAGDGAAGSNDSEADNVLPGDERLLPGGGESDLPAVPDTPGGSADTGGETGGPGGGGTSPVPPVEEDHDASALVSIGPEGAEVDTSAATAGVAGSAGATVGISETGITVTADADQDDTSGALTVTVPVSLPTIPLP